MNMRWPAPLALAANRDKVPPGLSNLRNHALLTALLTFLRQASISMH
jgi:hypothetical protein